MPLKLQSREVGRPHSEDYTLPAGSGLSAIIAYDRLIEVISYHEPEPGASEVAIADHLIAFARIVLHFGTPHLHGATWWSTVLDIANAQNDFSAGPGLHVRVVSTEELCQ